MDRYKKAHPTDAEKAALWHIVRFFAFKWTLFFAIQKVAKMIRDMDKKEGKS